MASLRRKKPRALKASMPRGPKAAVTMPPMGGVGGIPGAAAPRFSGAAMGLGGLTRTKKPRRGI